MNQRIAGVGVAVVALIAAALLLLGRDDDEPMPTHERVPVTPEAVDAPNAPPPVQGSRPSSSSTPRPASPDDAPGSPPAGSPGLTMEVLPPPHQNPDVLEGIEITVWPLDRDGIQGAVNEVVPGIARCYEDALNELPDLAGKLVVAFEVEDVEGLGKVTEAWIEDDQLRDGPISDCVEDAMAALQFDPPAGGGKMRTTYPLVFRPD